MIKNQQEDYELTLKHMSSNEISSVFSDYLKENQTK